MLTSPFVFDGPLPPGDVVGRDEELATLRDRAAHGRFVLLHAPRRYGKTSLIHRLADDAARDRDLAVVTVDLEGVLTLDDIARRIGHAYQRVPRTAFGRSVGTLMAGMAAAGRVGVARAASPSPPARPTRPPPCWSACSASPTRPRPRSAPGCSWCSTSSSRSPRSPTPTRCSAPRSSTERDRVSYLFSGSEQSLLRAIFADRARPLFGQAEQIALGPLPDPVAADLVAAGFADTGRDPGVALGHLISTAAGHPQRLAFLADSLWQVTDQGETADGSTWAAALDRALRRANAEFLALESGLPMTQRKLALLLALGEPPTGAAASRMGLSKGAARGALQTLVGRGHVHDAEESPTLVDPLYGAWLRNRFGPP